jgi:hypothetical protein
MAAPASRAAAAAAPQTSTAHASSTKQPFTIYGGGRVGQALSEMGPGGDSILRRGEAFDLSRCPPSGPILVATRNDALQAVVDATPEQRRQDLVFLQNGMLQPWLDARGLGDNTQVLVYFAVAKLGDKPTDGVTELDPAGLTAAHGPHAEAVAARLAAGGLCCRVLGKEDFTLAMLDKLAWICAFMLIGAVHGGVTVGEVERDHADEVSALLAELGAAGAAAMAVRDARPRDETVARLRAYARSVAHFPTALKEQDWRNGWFEGLSKEAIAAGRADPCPLHTSLLAKARA